MREPKKKTTKINVFSNRLVSQIVKRWAAKTISFTKTEIFNRNRKHIRTSLFKIAEPTKLADAKSSRKSNIQQHRCMFTLIVEWHCHHHLRRQSGNQYNERLLYSFYLIQRSTKACTEVTKIGKFPWIGVFYRSARYNHNVFCS